MTDHVMTTTSNLRTLNDSDNYSIPSIDSEIPPPLPLILEGTLAS